MLFCINKLLPELVYAPGSNSIMSFGSASHNACAMVAQGLLGLVQSFPVLFPVVATYRVVCESELPQKQIVIRIKASVFIAFLLFKILLQSCFALLYRAIPYIWYFFPGFLFYL